VAGKSIRASQLAELSGLLLDNVDIVLRKPDGKESGVDKLDEIVKYIAANYTSNQLSVQSIAERTYLSMTYLCAFFKKSTVARLTITSQASDRESKGLLQDRNIKLYEITAAIGLIDPITSRRCSRNTWALHLPSIG